MAGVRESPLFRARHEDTHRAIRVVVRNVMIRFSVATLEFYRKACGPYKSINTVRRWRSRQVASI